MDWVIPVRVAARSEELRYMLRSLAEHVPQHGRVWLVGHRPAWARAVEHIPTVQDGTKYQNTTRAVRAACENEQVSDPFVLANDDMFTMRRCREIPVLHRGPIREVEAYYARRGSGAYLRGMRETRELLEQLGVVEPLSYELHVPLVVGKAAMLAALDAGRGLDVVHKRSLYGNLAGVGGVQATDIKIIHGNSFPAPVGPAAGFLSTMPASWAGAAGRLIRARFGRPSPYEAP